MIDSKAKQIKTLLGVLGGGILTGGLIALSMLYYYDPSGAYFAKNMILSPENAYTLRFVEPGSKGKSEGKYTFSGLYFSYFDTASKQIKTLPISSDQYKAFYLLVDKDKSLVDPNDAVLHLFNSSHSSTLTLKVRVIGEDSSKGAEMPFYEIVFAPSGDHYRIQLRQSGPGQGWAYFYHPEIYQKVLQIFRS